MGWKEDMIKLYEESKARIQNMTPEERAEFEKRCQRLHDRWQSESGSIEMTFHNDDDFPPNVCPWCGETEEEDFDECLRCGYVRKSKDKE